MFCLHRGGVADSVWHLKDGSVDNRTAAVRISATASEAWNVEHGIGQGAVLNCFRFNDLANVLASEIRCVCNGVSVGNGKPRIHIFMFADDIVLLSEDPADLQRSVDVAARRASPGKSNFAALPRKQPSSARAVPADDVSSQNYAWAKKESQSPDFLSLGVVFHERLGWRCMFWHVVNASGTQAFHRQLCTPKTCRCDALSPLSMRVCDHHPHVLVYHLCAPIAPCQHRLLQWGRRLLLWPNGAPTMVVHGQLRWLDIKSCRLVIAAGLWARLLSLPRGGFPRYLAEIADTTPDSWISSIKAEPACIGVTARQPEALRSIVKHWMEHVQMRVGEPFNMLYCANLQAFDSLMHYRHWPPWPHLRPVAYGNFSCSMDVRFWVFARCGHGDFSRMESPPGVVGMIRPMHVASVRQPCPTHLNTHYLSTLHMRKCAGVGVSNLVPTKFCEWKFCSTQAVSLMLSGMRYETLHCRFAAACEM